MRLKMYMKNLTGISYLLVAKGPYDYNIFQIILSKLHHGQTFLIYLLLHPQSIPEYHEWSSSVAI